MWGIFFADFAEMDLPQVLVTALITLISLISPSALPSETVRVARNRWCDLHRQDLKVVTDAGVAIQRIPLMADTRCVGALSDIQFVAEMSAISIKHLSSQACVLLCLHPRPLDHISRSDSQVRTDGTDDNSTQMLVFDHHPNEFGVPRVLELGEEFHLVSHSEGIGRLGH